MERTINVGLAGLGRFGKLHAGALARMSGVRLAAISDPIADEVDALGATYNVPGRYATFDELLAHPDLDCLFIVTPEHLHFGMALAAIERGLPIFIEKPLALTSAEGQRLVDAARRKNLPIQVGFVLRFEAQHAWLKEEIAAGKFGEIVSIRTKRNCPKSWFTGYGERANSVHETAIHDIDLVLWLLNKPCEKVYAVQRSWTGAKYPDATMALLQFAGGTTVVIEASWFLPERAPANVITDGWIGTIDAEFEIVGTEQSARFRNLDSGLEVWTAEIAKHPEPGLWPMVHGEIGGALREEDLHFIANVRERRQSTVASVTDAVAGLRIAEAIIASAESGGEIVLTTPNSIAPRLQ